MSSKQQTPARLVKGFRDILPKMARQREQAIRTLEDIFQNFGYQPIDTPTLEYTDVLLSKSAGETEKQIFRFEDAGGRDVAMRFDLTVPFARFLAMHRHEIGLPFRRYHIGKAWRGENPQKGRYREFYQCDFDIVGSYSVQADLDILLLAQKALEMLGVGHFVIHINHRQILLDLLKTWNLDQHYREILSILDKMHKVGAEKTTEELSEVIPSYTKRLWQFVQVQGNSRTTLENLIELCDQEGVETSALAHTQEIFNQLRYLGLEDFFVFDPCITRGLDYYTGVVFETFLQNMPEIGSVCSGGRYDNLVGLYGNDEICGIGGSIGLDRLLAALEDIPGQLSESPAVDVILIDTGDMAPQRELQRALHVAGIKAACFPDNKKLEQQFRYAESLGVRVAIFFEADKGYSLRNMIERNNIAASNINDAVVKTKEILADG